MSKPNASKTSNNKVLKAIKSHKLIVVLLLLLMIFPISFAYNYYKDWDNAQMIKGLAKDFPALVEEVEVATGLGLEIKTDCSITQEKFSEGVKTCELSVASLAGSEVLDSAFKVFQESKVFPKSNSFQNGEGFDATYRNKNSCSFRNKKSIYSTCITAVREANIDLALSEFKLK